jgi:ATP-dependent RNA/DNA helicase IGHMBP2
MPDFLLPIQQSLELLLLEKQHEYDFFKNFIQKLSLKDRREKGFTWFPLQVMRSGFTFGDRAFVVVERTTHLEDSHQFREGKLVNLFTFNKNAYRPERAGVVDFVHGHQIKIIFNSKDLPDWLNNGNVGMDLMFDERTYLEMEKALRTVLAAHGNRAAELRDIFLGLQQPTSHPISSDHYAEIPRLNTSQNLAVQQVLASKDVAVIHGPPGTGKTTTIVQAIKRMKEQESTVLVASASNAAVDLLTEKLAEQGVNVVRIGNISRIDEAVVRQTLEDILARHPETKNVKKIRIQAAEYRLMAGQYKRKFGLAEIEQRDHLKKEARELSSWANQLEDKIIDEVLDGAEVIACTLVGAAHTSLAKRRFRTVVIDEASQALEPATWIPILKSSRVVLVGDPYQLPPTVKCIEAQRRGFGMTLIERCIKNFSSVSILTVQYRMNEMIMGFSNEQFYGGLLRADETVKNHVLAYSNDETPLVFIDTAGCGFEEKTNEDGKSRYNEGEYLIFREHLLQLMDKYGVSPLPDIALITPYKAQITYMRKEIANDPILKLLPIETDTIDSFQGQEADIVYISLVRSNNKSEIGFLSDYRRMNVALTRAKKKMVVIGDTATIGGNPFYANFLAYCDKHGAYRSAWELMATSTE